MVTFVGICGGSGSGKSTLAYGLQARYPEQIEVVHFDDYQKKKRELTIYNGIPNWDTPESINTEQLLQDMIKLSQGENVQIMTRSELHNPDWKTKGRIPHTVYARDLIFVEGFLALADERLLKQYTLSIFLDLDQEERLQRRTKMLDREYLEKVLIPMHKQHVDPCKDDADLVLHAADHTPFELQDIVETELKKRELL
jgi:uridine kinase